MSPMTLVITLVLIMLGGTAIYLIRKSRSLKVRLPEYAANAAKLFPEAFQEGITEEEMPVRAVWYDGPPGRRQRREGVVVRRKGKRSFLLPDGAMSRREAVRRRTDTLRFN